MLLNCDTLDYNYINARTLRPLERGFDEFFGFLTKKLIKNDISKNTVYEILKNYDKII